jgi:radical SAM protein with 4Fe4S-binding SPASM domain
MRAILDNIRFRPKICVWEITTRCNMRCLHCASDFNENWSRGKELSLKEARALCDDLKALGCEKIILCLNPPELPAMEELFARLEIDVWRLQLGAPSGRLARHPELLIKPDMLPPIADFIVAAKQRNRVLVSVGDNIGYFSHHEPLLRKTPDREGLDFFCGCSAGCLNIGIEANGNVKGCLSLQAERFVEGNIRQESLARIWHKKGNFAYTREFEPSDLHGFCGDCEFGEICRGGCVFMAFSATGAPHNNPYCLHRIEGFRPAGSAA